MNPHEATEQRVTVVTDSAASLPDHAREAAGVRVVPMSLIVDGTLYPDGVLSTDEVLARSAGAPVSTAGPSPGDFLKVLEDLPTPQALVATVSSNMSSTFEAAVTASRMFGPERVVVLDTGTAAGAEGLVVLAAAAAARRGDDLVSVTEAAREVTSRVHLVAALENLDHLARSGRVPGIAARAGHVVGVRPVFEFRNGHARPRRPALSQEAALERLVAACRHGAPAKGRLRAAVLDAHADHLAAELEQQVRSCVPEVDLYRAPFSSVMVAHTGPGLIGLAWWWQDLEVRSE